MLLKRLPGFVTLWVVLQLAGADSPEEEQGVRYANRCEACKILATELEARLGETGKSHDVIEIGYSVDDVKGERKTTKKEK